jgi:cystathionine beta-lyase
MSFKPPIEVLTTLENEIKRGFLGYYGGIESYRREVTKWLKTKHDWEPKPEWVNTAHGLVAAIGTALRAFTNQSDGIIIFSPVYHQFRNIIKANNRELIESEMIKKNGRYYLDLNNLENKMKGNEKVVILCSPHNPSGRIWTKNEQIEVAYFCKKHNLILIIDEIHNDLINPENKHITFPRIGEDYFQNFILMTSTTKTFNIAGGLMGNVIIPNNSLRDKFQKANFATGETPNRFGMILGEVAMRSGHQWLNDLLIYIEKNKKIFDNEINKLNTLVSMNIDATYLAWVDFTKTGDTENNNFQKLKYESKIISNRGSTFGLGGYNHFRFNLATSTELVKKSTERIKSFFN